MKTTIKYSAINLDLDLPYLDLRKTGDKVRDGRREKMISRKRGKRTLPHLEECGRRRQDQGDIQRRYRLWASMHLIVIFVS